METYFKNIYPYSDILTLDELSRHVMTKFSDVRNRIVAQGHLNGLSLYQPQNYNFQLS